MNITFFKASDLESNMKATIHVSGRLGFNSNAIRKMNFDEYKFIKIGQSENYEKDKILYLALSKEESDVTFAVSKAGEYFYANTKALFDLLEYEYESKKIIFDMSDVTISNEKYFKLKPRIRERKKGDNE